MGRGRGSLEAVVGAFDETHVDEELDDLADAFRGASVAAPLDWDELSESKLDSQSYTMENIFKHLARMEDPWKDFSLRKAPLPELKELPEREKQH